MHKLSHITNSICVINRPEPEGQGSKSSFRIQEMAKKKVYELGSDVSLEIYDKPFFLSFLFDVWGISK